MVLSIAVHLSFRFVSDSGCSLLCDCIIHQTLRVRPNAALLEGPRGSSMGKVIGTFQIEIGCYVLRFGHCHRRARASSITEHILTRHHTSHSNICSCSQNIRPISYSPRHNRGVPHCTARSLCWLVLAGRCNQFLLINIGGATRSIIHVK